MHKEKSQSGILWITGLSAAGKTTIATAVTHELRSLSFPTVLIDGDLVRECLDVKTLNTREDRYKLAFSYARLAKMIASQGIYVVVGVIALFKEIHIWNRENIPGYFEVFLNVPLEELRRRDPKGLYKRYDDGEIKNIAGLDVPVDFPKDPHLQIDYHPDFTAELITKKVLTTFHEFRKFQDYD